MDKLKQLFEDADKALEDLFARAEAEKIRVALENQRKENQLLIELRKFLSSRVPEAAMPYVDLNPSKKILDDLTINHFVLFTFPDAYPIGLWVWRHEFSGEFYMNGEYSIYKNDPFVFAPDWRAQEFLVALGASRKHYKEDAQVLDTVTNQVV